MISHFPVLAHSFYVCSLLFLECLYPLSYMNLSKFCHLFKIQSKCLFCSKALWTLSSSEIPHPFICSSLVVLVSWITTFWYYSLIMTISISMKTPAGEKKQDVTESFSSFRSCFWVPTMCQALCLALWNELNPCAQTAFGIICILLNTAGA